MNRQLAGSLLDGQVFLDYYMIAWIYSWYSVGQNTEIMTHQCVGLSKKMEYFFSGLLKDESPCVII